MLVDVTERIAVNVFACSRRRPCETVTEIGTMITLGPSCKTVSPNVVCARVRGDLRLHRGCHGC